MSDIRQLEIWEVFLDPTMGSEQNGRRPALVVQGNLANKFLNTIIVCPLTTKLKNYQGNLIIEPTEDNGLDHTSEVMTIHIRSISKSRFKKKLGTISKMQFEVVKTALDKIIRY